MKFLVLVWVLINKAYLWNNKIQVLKLNQLKLVKILNNYLTALLSFLVRTNKMLFIYIYLIIINKKLINKNWILFRAILIDFNLYKNFNIVLNLKEQLHCQILKKNLNFKPILKILKLQLIQTIILKLKILLCNKIGLITTNQINNNKIKI